MATSKAKPAVKKPRGRPLTFSKAKAAEICRRLAAGESLRAICRDEGLPPEATVRGWVIDDVYGFAAQYTRARELGFDALAEEALAIADTPQEGEEREESETGVKVKTGDMLGHRKLQVDARKWFLSKLAPKRYGDKTAIEHSGNIGLEGLVAGGDD